MRKSHLKKFSKIYLNSLDNLKKKFYTILTQICGSIKCAQTAIILSEVQMEKKIKQFGDFIKEKRMSSTGQITLKDMSERLGISLSLLSDIENNRRKPFDADKLEIFASELNLNSSEVDLLYDLAGRERGSIPSDIEDIMMYSDIGDMARMALRKSKTGEITIDDWKKFIQYKENGKKK